MSESETKTVAQEPSTKEDNVAQPPVKTPDPSAVAPEASAVSEEEPKKTITLQEAVVQLEKLYTEKEEAVKAAQVEASKAQLALSQAEREALVVLRQLTPLQNRFLLNTIQEQKKQLDASPGKLPAVSE